MLFRSQGINRHEEDGHRQKCMMDQSVQQAALLTAIFLDDFDLLDRVLFISSIHMRFLHSYFRLSDEQSQLRRRRVHAGS